MAENDLDNAQSWANRRGSERKKLIIDVRFDGGDGTGIANTRDIGSGGLYMTTTAQLDQIAKQKYEDLNASSLEQARKMIAGTARSMGIDVID